MYNCYAGAYSMIEIGMFHNNNYPFSKNLMFTFLNVKIIILLIHSNSEGGSVVSITLYVAMINSLHCVFCADNALTMCFDSPTRKNLSST